MKFVIVGLGTVGCSLCYVMSLNNCGGFILVDNDTLSENNLPQLFDLKEFIDLPKVIAISTALKNQFNIYSETFYEYYDNTFSFNNSINNEYIFVDCRDCRREDSRFNFKINLDGDYGTIIVNPTNNYLNSINSRYVFGNNLMNSLLISLEFVKLLKTEFDDRKEFKFNFESGEAIKYE